MRGMDGKGEIHRPVGLDAETRNKEVLDEKTLRDTLGFLGQFPPANKEVQDKTQEQQNGMLQYSDEIGRAHV